MPPKRPSFSAAAKKTKAAAATSTVAVRNTNKKGQVAAAANKSQQQQQKRGPRSETKTKKGDTSDANNNHNSSLGGVDDASDSSEMTFAEQLAAATALRRSRSAAERERQQREVERERRSEREKEAEAAVSTRATTTASSKKTKPQQRQQKRAREGSSLTPSPSRTDEEGRRRKRDADDDDAFASSLTATFMGGSAAAAAVAAAVAELSPPPSCERWGIAAAAAVGAAEATAAAPLSSSHCLASACEPLDASLIATNGNGGMGMEDCPTDSVAPPVAAVGATSAAHAPHHLVLVAPDMLDLTQCPSDEGLVGSRSNDDGKLAAGGGGDGEEGSSALAHVPPTSGASSDTISKICRKAADRPPPSPATLWVSLGDVSSADESDGGGEDTANACACVVVDDGSRSPQRPPSASAPYAATSSLPQYSSTTGVGMGRGDDDSSDMFQFTNVLHPPATQEIRRSQSHPHHHVGARGSEQQFGLFSPPAASARGRDSGAPVAEGGPSPQYAAANTFLLPHSPQVRLSRVEGGGGGGRQSPPSVFAAPTQPIAPAAASSLTHGMGVMEGAGSFSGGYTRSRSHRSVELSRARSESAGTIVFGRGGRERSLSRAMGVASASMADEADASLTVFPSLPGGRRSLSVASHQGQSRAWGSGGGAGIGMGARVGRSPSSASCAIASAAAANERGDLIAYGSGGGFGGGASLESPLTFRPRKGGAAPPPLPSSRAASVASLSAIGGGAVPYSGGANSTVKGVIISSFAKPGYERPPPPPSAYPPPSSVAATRHRSGGSGRGAGKEASPECRMRPPSLPPPPSGPHQSASLPPRQMPALTGGQLQTEGEGKDGGEEGGRRSPPCRYYPMFKSQQQQQQSSPLSAPQTGANVATSAIVSGGAIVIDLDAEDEDDDANTNVVAADAYRASLGAPTAALLRSSTAAPMAPPPPLPSSPHIPTSSPRGSGRSSGGGGGSAKGRGLLCSDVKGAKGASVDEGALASLGQPTTVSASRRRGGDAAVAAHPSPASSAGVATAVTTAAAPAVAEASAATVGASVVAGGVPVATATVTAARRPAEAALEGLFPTNFTREGFLADARRTLQPDNCLQKGQFWEAIASAEFIGEGSFGLVWRCVTVEGDVVAVKSCPVSFHEPAAIDDAYSLLREIAVMRLLNEERVPYVLPLHAAFMSDDTPPSNTNSAADGGNNTAANVDGSGGAAAAAIGAAAGGVGEGIGEALPPKIRAVVEGQAALAEARAVLKASEAAAKRATTMAEGRIRRRLVTESVQLRRQREKEKKAAAAATASSSTPNTTPAKTKSIAAKGNGSKKGVSSAAKNARRELSATPQKLQPSLDGRPFSSSSLRRATATDEEAALLMESTTSTDVAAAPSPLDVTSPVAAADVKNDDAVKDDGVDADDDAAFTDPKSAAFAARLAALVDADEAVVRLRTAFEADAATVLSLEAALRAAEAAAVAVSGRGYGGQQQQHHQQSPPPPLRLPKFAAIDSDSALRCDATIFLVVDLCDGDLDDVERRKGADGGEAVAKRVAFCVSMALNAMHRLGLAHLDLKPANILFSFDRGGVGGDLAASSSPSTSSLLANTGGGSGGAAPSSAAALGPAVKFVLSDFGNCQLVGPSYAAEAPNGAIGTYEYMDYAALKHRSCARATDCFSLGCTLYELLAGHRYLSVRRPRRRGRGPCGGRRACRGGGDTAPHSPSQCYAPLFEENLLPLVLPSLAAGVAVLPPEEAEGVEGTATVEPHQSGQPSASATVPAAMPPVAVSSVLTSIVEELLRTDRSERMTAYGCQRRLVEAFGVSTVLPTPPPEGL